MTRIQAIRTGRAEAIKHGVEIAILEDARTSRSNGEDGDYQYCSSEGTKMLFPEGKIVGMVSQKGIYRKLDSK